MIERGGPAPDRAPGEAAVKALRLGASGPAGRARPGSGSFNSVRRVTFSRNYTLSLSRTCQCYCKYCAFATHRAHIHPPEEVERRLEEATRRNAKELLVLTGERPEVNPEVAERLADVGPRGLHLLRGLGMRAGAGARHPPPHQPRRALAARTWPACAR